MKIKKAIIISDLKEIPDEVIVVFNDYEFVFKSTYPDLTAINSFEKQDPIPPAIKSHCY